ncbi:type II toxin-antitoxin system VapC family toxin [Hymenobacter saemangeumensis]|uniref:Type II toxin-antitoxin system VapC family toxin n=1 Tax=Hymenobacter saemangeumensis TaxID=1084522 RepID=A0ABP8ISM6_9BACT
MSNLLDTHTLIWFLNGDTSLSERARQAIQSPNALNFVSIASLWEIAIKLNLSKLELQMPFAEVINQLAANGFRVLPIDVADTLLLSTLPFHHRDPFDRIIICQGISSRLSILSKDQNFSYYDVEVVW